MSAYQDFREFLSALEQEQQLLRITEQVKFEPDLAAAACALARMGGPSPAIVFNNIAGCTNAQVAVLAVTASGPVVNQSPKRTQHVRSKRTSCNWIA
jgi:UbiD family decarboxylase